MILILPVLHVTSCLHLLRMLLTFFTGTIKCLTFVADTKNVAIANRKTSHLTELLASIL